MPEPNKHVEQYLDHYLQLPHATNYAVMLNGAWGVGKTFFLRRYLQQKFDNESKHYVFVSLFGLRSTEEIDAAMFQAIYLGPDSPLTKKTEELSESEVGKQVTHHANPKAIFGKMGKILLSKLNIETSDVLDCLNKFSADIYVFDDLERAKMDPEEIFGYLNQFVEHADCKVIVIANEDQMVTEDYREKKEKVIGKTLLVRSEYELAFRFFLDQITDSHGKTFLESKSSEITAVYRESNIENLRILQQTLWDFERMYQHVEEGQRSLDRGMTQLLRLFFALSFEVKFGRITGEHLLNRHTGVFSALRNDKNPDPDSFAAINDKYSLVNLADTVLSNDVLHQCLVEGYFDREAISKCLLRSRYFYDPAQEPEWMTVWHVFTKDEEPINNAISQMELKFSKREYTNPGVILHVFSNMLLLQQHGMLPGDERDVNVECVAYLNDISAAGTLEPPIRYDGHDYLSTGYAGLGFNMREDKTFQALFVDLKSKLRLAYEATFSDHANLLMEKLKDEPNEFVQMICQHPAPREFGDDVPVAIDYVGIPVLKEIDPREFVSSFLSLSASTQSEIGTALRSRYKFGCGALPQERGWLVTVKKLLENHAEEASDHTKFRIGWLISSSFKPFIETDDASDNTEVGS